MTRFPIEGFLVLPDIDQNYLDIKWLADKLEYPISVVRSIKEVQRFSNRWAIVTNLSLDKKKFPGRLILPFSDNLKNATTFSPLEIWKKWIDPFMEDSPIITCQLAGGLGNQIFQIFTTLATAWRQGLRFEFSHTNPIGDNKRPHYWKSCFHQIPTVSVVGHKTEYKQIIRERSDTVFEKFNDMEENTQLLGMFQCEKYFHDFYPRLTNILKLPSIDQQNVQSRVDSWRVKYPGKTLVALHVRRGDYLNLAFCHNTLPIDYYINASRYFDKDDCVLIIFSDDMEWCKNNLPKHINHTLEFDTKDEDYRELFSMIQLDGFIIANSSFSWMGAYLSDKEKQKKIVAPIQWFNPATGIKWQRVYCSTWTIVGW